MRRNGNKRHMDCSQTTFERPFSAAEEIFERKGYMGTTVREIVATAGVTKPVLYYYFGNKENLYLTLFRKAFAKLKALLDEFERDGGHERAIDRLKNFCNRLCSLFREQNRLLYLIQGFPPEAPLFDLNYYHDWLSKMLKQLVFEAVP
jgi:AcrR family transcriptional regulator